MRAAWAAWAAYARIDPQAISPLVPPAGQSGGNKKWDPSRDISRNNGDLLIKQQLRQPSQDEPDAIREEIRWQSRQPGRPCNILALASQGSLRRCLKLESPFYKAATVERRTSGGSQ